MREDDIQEINSILQERGIYDQGVFVQPTSIPHHIKEPVIYTRYETGGMTGGSCWGGRLHSYMTEPPENKFEVLDLVLERICPKITYLQYKKIDKMIHTNSEDSHSDYYGNSSDYRVEYIILSELEEYLNTITDNE